MDTAIRNARYTAQTWDGQVCIVHLTGLSLESARGVALAHSLCCGYAGRLMAESPVDYCEVYLPDGTVRRGTFAETTTTVTAFRHGVRWRKPMTPIDAEVLGGGGPRSPHRAPQRRSITDAVCTPNPLRRRRRSRT